MISVGPKTIKSIFGYQDVLVKISKCLFSFLKKRNEKVLKPKKELDILIMGMIDWI